MSHASCTVGLMLCVNVCVTHLSHSVSQQSLYYYPNINASLSTQVCFLTGRVPIYQLCSNLLFYLLAMTSGPIGDNAFNPNIPPPNMPTNALNTPFTNNAQHNQSAVQGSSRINKPNQPRVPIGKLLLNVLAHLITLNLSHLQWWCVC